METSDSSYLVGIVVDGPSACAAYSSAPLGVDWNNVNQALAAKAHAALLRASPACTTKRTRVYDLLRLAKRARPFCEPPRAPLLDAFLEANGKELASLGEIDLNLFARFCRGASFLDREDVPPQAPAGELRSIVLYFQRRYGLNLWSFIEKGGDRDFLTMHVYLHMFEHDGGRLVVGDVIGDVSTIPNARLLHRKSKSETLYTIEALEALRDHFGSFLSSDDEIFALIANTFACVRNGELQLATIRLQQYWELVDMPNGSQQYTNLFVS